MEAKSDKNVRSVAILGMDYQGLRPALKVAAGDMVQAGQVLLTDRAHPDVAIVAPITGRVASLDYGPRRSLSALILHREENPADVKPADVPATPHETAPHETTQPDMATRDSLRSALLSRGLWPALRTRPFGRFPDPEKTPDAIFVIATDSAPKAADPRLFLAGQEQHFNTGVHLLALLGDGPVYVCQSPGVPLVTETPRIRNMYFGGPHPAGLASTHIQDLHPVGHGQEVWTIDCQDAAAIGHLAETGQADPTRIVALTGAQTGAHRSQGQQIRTHPGASLRDILGENTRACSGSVLGRRGLNWLGRFDRQITVLDPQRRSKWPKWLMAEPEGGKPADRHARAIIPTAALERALPRPFLPVPLMRALSVGDTDAAARLGALSLIEEDMALLTSLCTSGADYAALLRRVLNALEEIA